MSKRTYLSPEQKVAIVRRHLLENVAVSDLCDEKYTFQAAALAVGVSEKSLHDWHKKFAPQMGYRHHVFADVAGLGLLGGCARSVQSQGGWLVDRRLVSTVREIIDWFSWARKSRIYQ